MDINNKYRVIGETNNIVVQEKSHNSVQHKDFWTNVGYFATVGNALNYLIDLEIEKSELKDLQTVADMIKTAQESIEKTLLEIPTTALQHSLEVNEYQSTTQEV